MVIVKISARPKSDTGCVDAAGRPIHFGQDVLVKNEFTGFKMIQGIAWPIATASGSGKPRGFCISYNGCEMVWKPSKGQRCYDCFAVE